MEGGEPAVNRRGRRAGFDLEFGINLRDDNPSESVSGNRTAVFS